MTTKVGEGMLTVAHLKEAMPSRQKTNINQALVDELNNLTIDPEYAETFRENFVGFCHVLQDPNTTMKGYVSAIKYVGYKMMEMTNQQSYILTFPERYNRLQKEGKADVYLRSLVSAYARGNLVKTLLNQAMVPIWLVNQDNMQKAINTQVGLMTTAKSEMVRTQAANSLITNLKPPEAAKVEIDITVKEDDSIRQLKNVIADLALQQLNAIKAGRMTPKDVAEVDIIEGEVILDAD